MWKQKSKQTALNAYPDFNQRFLNLPKHKSANTSPHSKYLRYNPKSDLRKLTQLPQSQHAHSLNTSNTTNDRNIGGLLKQGALARNNIRTESRLWRRENLSTSEHFSNQRINSCREGRRHEKMNLLEIKELKLSNKIKNPQINSNSSDILNETYSYRLKKQQLKIQTHPTTSHKPKEKMNKFYKYTEQPLKISIRQNKKLPYVALQRDKSSFEPWFVNDEYEQMASSQNIL